MDDETDDVEPLFEQWKFVVNTVVIASIRRWSLE